MDKFLTIITNPFAMLVYGVLMHATKTMAEAQLNDQKLMMPWQYLARWPYAAAFTFLSALAGYAALYGTEELTRINAFGLGYMANSVADVIGRRGIEVLGNVSSK